MKLLNFIQKNKEKITDIVILIGIYIFLLSFFKPSLILLDTTTSGGDTGSHNYLAYYTKNYLLPHGKLIGWSPDWYAGFPIFQYYFVFPYLIMSLLSFVIPLNIAFKLVTISGTFLMPLTAYFAMRFFGFKFPAPILAAVLTLPFLFMEANSMWGGNIPSTLAGEFSYSLSFALTILFIGSIYHGVKKNRFLVFNSILLALITLTHIYTTIFVVISSVFFLLEKNRKELIRKIKYLATCYIIAFLIVSFWVLPLSVKLQYRTPLNYIWNINDIKQIFPEILWINLFFALIGFLIALREKDGRIIFLVFALTVTAVLYNIGPSIGLADIRFVTFAQYFPALIAAFGIHRLMTSVRYKELITLFIAVLIILIVNDSVTYIDFWIKWNYEGFESKTTWPKLNAITTYLRELPYGRIVHEYSPDHDKFGTPRTFEMFPVFTGKPVLEGLTIESAVTAPHVFYIQSEISERPTCPIPGLRCSSFNIDMATKHLKLFNVNYLVATSGKLKGDLEDNHEYTFLESFEEIEVYRVNNTGKYVELPKYEPVIVDTKDWKSVSYEWFKREDLIDVPLIFDSKVKDGFNLIAEDLDNIPKVPLKNDCFIEENVENEEILIKTNCIGKPLLIKISYLPNWQVDGAKKVYLASPAFMIIVPQQENVRLYYGNTIFDSIGMILSILGIGIVALVWSSKKFVSYLVST